MSASKPRVLTEIRRVGFVGLGDQGAPMAEMIARGGFALDVWARRTEVAEEFRAFGAEPQQTLAALASRCDMVAVCVTDDAAVDEVVRGRGLLEAMPRGTVLVVHSTVTPETCRRIASEVAGRGIDVLDAPVSGGRPAAVARSLSVMVGGDRAVFDRIVPVMETYAANPRYVGVLGAAQALKIVNNGLFVANMALAAAALELCERQGLDRTTAREVLAASSGRSTGLEALDALVGTEWGRHAWTVLRKDLALLTALAGTDPRARDLVVLATRAGESLGSTEGG